MSKFVLFQYTDKKSEIEDLKDRIEKIKHRGYIIADSVKGSSKYPPYNIKNYIAIGFDDISQSKIEKLEQILTQKCNELLDINIEAEEFINTIDDSEIRQILRHKYIDDKNWIQIAHDMNNTYKKNKYTADSVRMKHDRFIKKFKKF